ncbi:imm11 family protein [Pseudoxanthomonas koreensis]|uniref:imm11 family protein n=1 Tax=Pseudoxanthomonas koreensis TaxID=266061 RepID=UPI0035A66C8C
MTDQPATSATSPAVPHAGKFYVIESSFHGGGKVPGIEIANRDRLWAPGWAVMLPPDGDPNQYPETPHLVQVPEKGGMPRDLEELAGIWIVSERARQVFESVDPEGFAFAACDFTLADGSSGPQYYLCGVVRTLDALDEEASRLRIILSDDYPKGKHYSLVGGANLVFKEHALGSAHVFRTPFSSNVFCDRPLHDAIKEAGLSGIWLIDAADY